ncbi:MAG TPA: anthranilate synthase component I [Candidatus Marinimicrobia bacterium]|jgi:anthranilate synthase component 1|nr:anthranilate synthase component I [Candidatus Neomarinimicrobiota bacterium]|tara:strand:+ start:1170 stop:2633 length:1464 start_codon:yes stop_codon:yes gene_type:complete
MDFNTFHKLANEYKTVPVYKRILADLLTPISAYMKLVKSSKYAFILESVEKGEQYGRYSFIGRNPHIILKSEKDKTQIWEDGLWQEKSESFLSVLRETQKNYKAPKLSGIPHFTGGLVGFMGYESITWVEDIPIYVKDELQCPDALFMLYHELIAFDHLQNQIILFSNVQVETGMDLEQAYINANLKIDKMGEDLHTDIDYQTPAHLEQSELQSNFTQSEFESAVCKAKEHIEAGDVFQLVLSQRFQRKTSVDPLTMYRALRSINPSPYMFHLKLDNFDIIGASPELLVKVEDDEIEIRPIAGTRKRGGDAEEDKKLADDLLSDEKERAEHLMLVDLGRNDVGRAAQFDSVEVKEFMVVEYYSHVMHIVSDVRGKLQDGKDVFDALYSGFPAGTLTGAPKIRAMEIIYDLEPTRRGVYSGAVGYFDFTGDINTCIAIRTMVMKDGTVYFQSGAGIVYDSDPNKEFEETVNKAKAINSAIDLAENGLV